MLRIANDDRYDRMRLVPGCDPERLRRARICLVGVGALGNEVAKTLALLGVGRLLLVDRDTVCVTNLTRSVLFRAADAGAPKAHVAAARLRELNADVDAAGCVADLPEGLGLGTLADHDIVCGCLDSREARVALNAAAFRAGIPYVDGALGDGAGTVRVFRPPDGPCYECGLTAADWRLLAARAPCGLLGQALAQEGRLPTTPMAAAAVGAFQVAEVLRLLGGDASHAGTALVWNGDGPTLYRTRLAPAPECAVHETWPAPLRAALDPARHTAVDLLAFADGHLAGAGAAEVRLPRTWVASARCTGCGDRATVERAHVAIHRDGREAACARCGALREPETVVTVGGTSPFAARTLGTLGFAPADVARVTRGPAAVYVRLDGAAGPAPGPGDGRTP